jgi:hypothetical protein
MTLRHKIDAALLSIEGVKVANTVVTPAPGQSVRVRLVVEDEATPLASMAAHKGGEASSPAPADIAHSIQRMLARAGIPQETVSPLTQLPEADPAILASVLERARVARDPIDYLRLLSHSRHVNELARTAALPALLLTDALTQRDVSGARTREAVIDALRNLQLPAGAPARSPEGPSFQGSIPPSARAYPMWYPR